MKAFIVDNVILYRDSCGKYYAPSIYSYYFLERYLKVFDEIRFLAKTKYVQNIDERRYNLVSGPNVEIVELPWYKGIKQMMHNIIPIMRAYLGICKGVDCCVFRIAQIESFFVYTLGNGRKLPYAVEVVNDPDTFTDMPYWMRKFSVEMVKQMCKKADGASYVTEHTLQKKYPCLNGFKTHYSSIELEDSDISLEPIAYNPKYPIKIIHVANAIDGDAKGHTTLIKSVAYVKKRGGRIELSCVGDGSSVTTFEKLAKDLNVDDCVRFVGRYNDKKEIYKLLRNSNLMVLPTRMEGLPRTIIEAFAAGLPCISTPIAGIPELLDSKYLFDPDDYIGFGNKILELAQNPEELYEMSKMNIQKAKDFVNSILVKRRTEFYKKLRAVAEK